MNCFTHAYSFLDDPYFVVGACVPDWLSAVDRKVRTREKFAAQFVTDQDPRVASMARGIIQHHQDDRWFHQTRAFAELNLEFAVSLRDRMPGDDGFRPSFLGHILIEVLLDAHLTARDPSRLEYYYAQLDSIEPQLVESTINRIAIRKTDQLVPGINRFRAARFLFDYLDDQQLLNRMNGVMRRVGLPLIDQQSIADWIPTARQRVDHRSDELLQGREFA